MASTIMVSQWTEPLPVAQLRADPSGVQGASTEFQADLLSGMSTITTRARYISLFTMARYYRMESGPSVETQLPLPEYFRRLEALIGVCTVRHHRHEATPTGIIGSGSAKELASGEDIPLALSVQRPAYNIFSGALGSLGLFDLTHEFGPLFEDAKPLAEAWDSSAAGPLGEMIRSGVLPASVPHSLVDDYCGAFCLCQVPHGSAEQEALTRRFLALDRAGNTPPTPEEKRRSASWRLLLELVRLTPTSSLGDTATMIRLLSRDLADLGGLERPMRPLLRQSLVYWRWVAARTLFERGWTKAFTASFRQVRSGLTSEEVRAANRGLTSEELRAHMRDRYGSPDETLAELHEHVSQNYESPEWLAERFSLARGSDGLCLLLAGLRHAQRDRELHDDETLRSHWNNDDIPFAQFHSRVKSALQARAKAATVWAEVAEESLIQHVQISLRKMRADNPDTLLVDFDDNRWIVPAKAQNANLYEAGGSSRLDIALRWAQEMGIVQEISKNHNVLTEAGEGWCAQWNEVYGE